MPAEGPAAYGFASALAVRDACLACGAPGAQLALKWPNDVLLGGAKLSGLLLELAAEGRRQALLVGIGVNLAEAPAVEAYEAAALSMVARAPSPTDFLERLDAALFARLGLWRAEGFGALKAAWLAAASGMDGALTVRLPNETVTGRAAGLSEAGALLLRTPGGLRAVTAGDVFFPGRAG